MSELPNAKFSASNVGLAWPLLLHESRKCAVPLRAPWNTHLARATRRDAIRGDYFLKRSSKALRASFRTRKDEDRPAGADGEAAGGGRGCVFSHCQSETHKSGTRYAHLF